MDLFRCTRVAGVAFVVALCAGCYPDFIVPRCQTDPTGPGCADDASVDADATASVDAADEGATDAQADTADAAPTCDAGMAMQPCGKCGTQMGTCGADGAVTWGACTGEGACAPDSTDETTAGCTITGFTKQRTCSTACTWVESPCGPPKGWRGIAAAPSGFAGRISHTAVWTGTEMIVFGGGGLDGSGALADGARYNPSTDSWTKLAAPPAVFSGGRTLHTAVWTGSKMIIWGGEDGAKTQRAEGAAYDPATNTWSMIAAAPISGCSGCGAIYSIPTDEMIVWGGAAAEGAAYKVSTNAWRKLAASPLSARNHFAAFHVSDDLGVFGGSNDQVDGARYSVAADTWELVGAVPVDFVGRHDFSWAASTNAFYLFGGVTEPSGKYLPRSDFYMRTLVDWHDSLAWSKLPDAPASVLAPPQRALGQAWFDGSRFYVWSGTTADASGAPYIASGGAVFDTVTSKWSAMPDASAPSPRAAASVVWTGDYAIIWGGLKSFSAFGADGATFRP